VTQPLTHRVTLKVKDPSFQDTYGHMYPGDLSAEGETVWYLNPADCDHRQTICISCIKDWTDGFWATIHFGPNRPKNVPLTFSLNDMVEIQEAFVTAAQLLCTAMRPLFDAMETASAQIALMATRPMCNDNTGASGDGTTDGDAQEPSSSGRDVDPPGVA
jgi:hypothetical protein